MFAHVRIVECVAGVASMPHLGGAVPLREELVGVDRAALL